MAADHRRARRAAGAVATVAVALAGGFGLLLFFVARDEAPVERERTATTSAPGPGEAVPYPAAGVVPRDRRARVARLLASGNVVLVYEDPAHRRALTRLAEEVTGGPPDPALEEAGQAVILLRAPGTRGVVGLAADRRLRARSPADPALRRFADAWLGRGAGG